MGRNGQLQHPVSEFSPGKVSDLYFFRMIKGIVIQHAAGSQDLAGHPGIVFSSQADAYLAGFGIVNVGERDVQAAVFL